MSFRIAAALTAACLFAAVQGAAAQTYTFTDLGTLGGANSFGLDLNASGQVTGLSSFGSGDSAVRPFLWSAGVMTPLATPAVGGGFANAINSAGQVAGYSFGAGGALSGARWTGAAVTPLNTLGGAQGVAFGINDRGQIVGFSDLAGGGFRATRWDGSTAIDLGTLGRVDLSVAADINNAGQIAGWSAIGDSADAIVIHAVRWQGTTPQDLGSLGGANRSSNGFGINDAGQVVGISQLAEGSFSHATRWDGSTAIDLGTLGGSSSFAADINNLGQTVGWSQLAAANGAAVEQRATLWNGTTPVDLNTLVDAPGWLLTEATAINDSGWITGSALHLASGNTRGYLLTVGPIPEPSTYALMLFGLGAVAWAARRRRRPAMSNPR
jgi:probable HAF family extracellular repeat protein